MGTRASEQAKTSQKAPERPRRPIGKNKGQSTNILKRKRISEGDNEKGLGRGGESHYETPAKEQSILGAEEAEN